MVLTRSRSGDSRREQTHQEPSTTAEPSASNQAPESSTSPVAVKDTGSGSTATTNTDATQTHGTLKPSDTRSRRSTASKKKRLAELEARERLAEMKVKQAKAERELQEIQLQRIRAEADSSEDDDTEDDLASVRIGTWLARPAPPPGGEARLPPHDVSGGRNGRDAAKDTGAATGAQPLRDDDGYEESVCAKSNKGNIASEMLHGNVSDKVIDVGTLAAALAQAARSSRDPPRYVQQLPIFDGKPGEWIAYKAAYCDSHTYFSCIENVARIRMSLRGTAKEAVGCLLFSQSDPQVILDALERRFGRPEALIMAELDHIKLLPKLNDNPRDICIFASRIANTVGTVEALKRIQYLHSPEMSRCIVEKLTPILKNKWYDYAANKKVEDIPELKRLSMFMNEEADKCSAYAQPERGNDDSNGVRQRRRVERTFNVNKETSNEQCPACKQHGHKLPDCSKYIQLDIDTRWDIAKNSNMCFRCLRNKHRRFMCKAPICDIKECNMKHHKLLHKERKVEATHNVATPAAPTPVITHETVTSARETVSTTSPQNRRAYLKIVPVTLIGPHTSVDTYALLDDGSTVTLLDASVADILGADGLASPMWIQGIGTEVKHEQSRTVSLHIQGKHHSDPQKIEAARTVTRLEIMAQTVQIEDINNCRHLSDIHSTLVYEHARPMILIGQDNWHLLVATETRTGARDQPVASYTKLGWVLHGCQYSVNKVIATFCGHIKTKENLEPIEETMKNFFKLESLGIEPRIPRDDPQQRALDILEQKSRRLPDGSFETGLLWKQEVPKIPNNYLGALKRLENLERRLDKDENLKTQYLQRLDNLFNSGYAEKAPDTCTTNKTWYLPHFPVVNPAKPHKPPRLVHDAAAKTAGLCLNDLLLSGPDLLQSLPGVLMRFRQNKIAVSADIKEMFMRIKIREEDRDALRFLWRSDQRKGPPGEYRMTSVIFGATSSPCTALYIKDRNARDFADRYPAAASAIINNHYMDDYLQSFSSEEEAKKITTEVDYIHKKANFVLCGWISNNKHVLNNNFAPSQDIKVLGGDDTEKALGLRWDTKEDCFIFRINKNKTPIVLLNNTRPATKREALSIIMSIFDPLGIISPITIPAKRILQNTWKYKTEWDKPLPEELQPKWKEWMESLSTIETLLIPRCYDYCDVTARELHTFVDASEEAYAAAVYWRTERSDGSVQVTLAAAKSRVAPLKPVSIPRLELQAALLGARLARTVVQEHDYEVSDLTYWSDSTTALAWIQAEPRTYKTFVAHRIAEIEELTKKNEWRWLPSKDNVADDATRSTPEHFNSKHRWFNGPEFLRKDKGEWPQDKRVIAPTNTGEERVKCHVINDTTVNDHLPNITRFSKWTRLIRTTARVLQFIDLCRPSKHTVEYKGTKKKASKDPTWKRTQNNKPVKKVTQTITKNKIVNYIPIPATYILRAEEQWVKGAQAESFTKEIAAIKDNKAAPGDSPLSLLSTYLDNAGVLRLRGRITAVQDVNEELKNPIVLEGKHRYTKLYIAYVHESLHHGGTEITVNELRQRLWITRLRPSVKNVIKGCLYCKIKKAKPAKPSTGNLPYPRLAHHIRPFTFTGLDYFGPITVSVGRRKEKRYGALFTCLTCRAIHIEIANSLSADSAIAALRRFIGRRGCPKEIWSDNATCFKAADRELGESALSALGSESNARSISWRYIPPASPFMGGAWERMVRAVKEALYVTLKEVHPSDETLATLLVEVENTVNSRPLTHVNVSPDEPEALTPNHILIGPNSHVPSPGNFTAADITARHQWRRAQALADVFWRRWVREYLPLLQNRREPYGSGTPPKVGDVVIICDPNLPRNTWPKGRVTKVLPGADGEIRVVDVMTKGHVLRRPTKRIVVLPTESPDGDGGRNVHDSNVSEPATDIQVDTCIL